LQLLLVVAAGLLLLFVLLGFSADWLAARIPFEYEQQLAERLAPADADVPGAAQRSAYLQALADRLTAQMALPEAMNIRVHYQHDDVVNAGATLGGHVIMFRGLIERMPHENALAMVLAHEIAHIKLRHPVRSLGRGAVLAVAIAALTGATGNSLGSVLVGEAGLLTALDFSRDQEAAADAEGQAAVAALYGHASGSAELFEVLLKEEQNSPLAASQISFLRSHPLSEDRIDALRTQALQNHWSLDQPTTPLPDFIAKPTP
jgi:predicted Zn-dependent protease